MVTIMAHQPAYSARVGKRRTGRTTDHPRRAQTDRPAESWCDALQEPRQNDQFALGLRRATKDLSESLLGPKHGSEARALALGVFFLTVDQSAR